MVTNSISDAVSMHNIIICIHAGGGSYVYPSANHTQFDHSIGYMEVMISYDIHANYIIIYRVCHIAGEFGRFLMSQNKEAKEKWPKDTESTNITEKEILCLQIAGLCHDLGNCVYGYSTVKFS